MHKIVLDGLARKQSVCDAYSWLPCMQALEEAFPETPLLPQDPQAAAAVKDFCHWCAAAWLGLKPVRRLSVAFLVVLQL